MDLVQLRADLAQCSVDGATRTAASARPVSEYISRPNSHAHHASLAPRTLKTATT